MLFVFTTSSFLLAITIPLLIPSTLATLSIPGFISNSSLNNFITWVLVLWAGKWILIRSCGLYPRSLDEINFI